MTPNSQSRFQGFASNIPRAKGPVNRSDFCWASKDVDEHGSTLALPTAAISIVARCSDNGEDAAQYRSFALTNRPL